MSALGHKRTFRNVATMSALPPKADIGPRMTVNSIFKIAVFRIYAQNFCAQPFSAGPFPSFPRQHGRTKKLAPDRHSGAAIADVDRRQKGRSERAKNQP